MEPRLTGERPAKHVVYPVAAALAFAGLCLLMVAGVVRAGPERAGAMAEDAAVLPSVPTAVSRTAAMPIVPDWVAALQQPGRAAVAVAEPLSITKEVSDPNPYLGDRISYTIHLTNTGSCTVERITLWDVLPFPVAQESVICEQCEMHGRALTYTQDVGGGTLPLPTGGYTETSGAAPAPTGAADAPEKPAAAPAPRAAEVVRPAGIAPAAVAAEVVRPASIAPAAVAAGVVRPASIAPAAVAAASAVTATFTATPRSGMPPLTVAFDNTSGGTITKTEWSFGDGGSSSAPSPTHTYTVPGQYDVSLTVWGDGGSDTHTEGSYITVLRPVTASFTATPTMGMPPLTVCFTSTSTGPITSTHWSFGDGATSNVVTPTHTYGKPGYYTVTLTVWGGTASHTYTATNCIHVLQPPAAAFSATPLSGTAVFTVAFTNNSTGDFTDSFWQFGDGVTSTEASPSHPYVYAGVYGVTLTVSGYATSSTHMKPGYITVYAPPDADFDAAPTSGPVPLVVTFTNTSTGVFETSLWEFGDGLTSTLASPTHTYEYPGTYDVVLSVDGPAGPDAEAVTHCVSTYILPITAWVAESLSWNPAELGPGQSVSITFSIPVMGVADGALLRNSAYVWYRCGSIERSTSSRPAESRVRARLTGSGAQIPALPVWVAPPLGVTYAQAWGDMDGDGDPDLAVTGLSGPAVYRNDGGPMAFFWTDASHQDLERDLIWADLTGDGLPELVTVGSGGLVVYAYDAPGSSFVPRQVLARSAFWLWPNSAVAVDLDNDGDLDVAVSNGPDPDHPYGWQSERCPVTLYRNDGSGTLTRDQFLSDSNLGLFSNIVSHRVSAADVNNDAFAELVYGLESASLYSYQYCWWDRHCTFYLFGCWHWDYEYHCATHWYWEYDAGLSMGYISPTMVETTPETPRWDWKPLGFMGGPYNDQNNAPYAYDVAWGDYDGDGFLDVAVSYYKSGATEGDYHIYRNNGPDVGIQYQFSEVYSCKTNMPAALDWGDMNGDGYLELIVAGRPPKIIRYTMAGFEARDLWPNTDLAGVIEAGDTIFRLRWVDYDGDGDLDLAMTSNRHPAAVFANFAPFLSPNPSTSLVDTWATSSVAWGDAYDDGDPDLLFGAAGDVGARLYRNVSGGFASDRYTTLSTSGFGRHYVAWGDYNADGDLELALTQESGWHTLVYENATGAGSPVWDADMGFGGRSLAWGYVNWMHGGLDLLVGGTSGANLYRYEVATGTLNTLPTVITDADTSSVAWGDYDGDLLLDIALVANGQPTVYHNSGDGTFGPGPVIAPSATISPGIEAASVVAWADYDGDGRQELTVGSNPGRVVVCRYDAASDSFGPEWQTDDAAHTTALAWADWDNDGDLDLAVGNAEEPNRVYLNLAAQGSPGRLVPLWQASQTVETTGLAWGDMDSDGDLDLAVSSWQGPRFYENTCARPSHLAEHFAQTMPLPSNPPCLSVDRPGATGPAYGRSSSEILTSPVEIRYTLYDPDGTRDELVRDAPGDPITTTRYEYSLDGGATWHPASAHVSWTGQVTLTSRPGQAATFLWDAAHDLAISDDARFRITVASGARGSPQRAMVSAVSPPFRVRGTTCMWPEYPRIHVYPPEPAPRRNEDRVFVGNVLYASGRLIFRWDFGDGTPIQLGQVTSHRYALAGPYVISMSVESEPCPIPQTVYLSMPFVVEQRHFWLPLALRE